jgi:Mn2+/Fe2+ NRAMP family transporter
MFIVTAAVTFVTAGLVGNLFPEIFDTSAWSAILFVICTGILWAGKYHLLDRLLKWVALLLVISTVTAFVSALIYFDPEHTIPAGKTPPYSEEGLIFLIALMGWMPTAVDISTWTSLWAEEKIKDIRYRPDQKESAFDFNLGYWLSAVMAVFFLGLGAMVLYRSDTPLSDSSPAFAGQLIKMYTSTIGNWSAYIIAVAAMATMFSTTITVIDGYSRAMSRTFKLLSEGKESRGRYILWMLITCIGAFMIISQFLNSLRALVDLATIMSFIIAVPAAYLNYRVIFSKKFPNEFKPGVRLKILAVAGLIFLLVFTLIFVVVYF